MERRSRRRECIFQLSFCGRFEILTMNERLAVVNIESGVIVNIVVAWQPPPDCTAVSATPEMAIGGTLIDGIYTPPQPVQLQEGNE